MAINTKPDQFGTYVDDMGQTVPLTYSTEAGHVGRMGETVTGQNPETDTTYGWIPSQFDFTGAKYDANTKTYYFPSGDILGYDASTGAVTSYIPADPNYTGVNRLGQQVGGYRGVPTFQGMTINAEGGTPDVGFLIDPNTHKYYKDANGNPIPSIGEKSGGNGFTDWMTENGWVLPLAMGAGAGLGAAGVIGGAAEGVGAGAIGAEAGGAAGYGSADAYMASAGLNPGTYAAADFVPSYASMGDYMSQAGLDAGNFSGSAFTSPDANPLTNYMNQAGMNPGTFEGSAFQMPSGLSASDAYKTLSRANNLAKLLSDVAGMGSSPTARMSGQIAGNPQQIAGNPQQLASLLGGGQQTNSFIGQIKGNQNPFLFVAPNQTAATEGTYDVSGSNMANALRKA
jgi:hypothetical protein